MSVLPKLIYGFNAVSIKFSMTFFFSGEIEGKKISKFISNHSRPQERQSSLEQKRTKHPVI
jgi:hypothetical protein